MNNNKKQITISRDMEKKMTLSLTVAMLITVNVCLPALVIGGILYWIFGS
jgi:hypothetical protein